MLLEYLLILLLGFVFGSFISAMTYRIPRGIPFVRGRSFCPHCKEKIKWHDNIPVLSYILLKGKCGSCHAKISIRYLLTELLSAAGFVLIFSLGGFTILNTLSILKLVFTLSIFVILLSILIIDLENQIIPDKLVYFGIVMAVAYVGLFDYGNIISSLFSGFIGASFLMIIHIITKGRGMGLGDVKFAILGGMIIGIRMLPIWLLLSFLTGGIAGSILILTGKAKLKTKIAFGPFLIVGIGLCMVFGSYIIRLMRV